MIFAAVVFRFGYTWQSAKWLVLEALVTVMFWTDLEERILPDELTLGGAALGLFFAFQVPLPGLIADLVMRNVAQYWKSFSNALGSALFFGALFWGIAVLYSSVRKQEGLGLGDVKLLLLIGAFFGLDNGVWVLLAGSVSGALFGVGQAIIQKNAIRTSELPFGSFLCLAAAVMPFWGS